MNILIGLLILCGGILMLVFRYNVYRFTGDWGWAEKYLGYGSTPTAIVLFGCLIIMIGIFIITGAINTIILFFLGPFVKGPTS